MERRVHHCQYRVLLAVFAWCAVSKLGTSATVLLACSPIVWWIDKAHVEVFNFALLGTALVLCRNAPRTALLLLGVLTAQNPGFALILVPVAAACRGRRAGRSVAVSRRPRGLGSSRPCTQRTTSGDSQRRRLCRPQSITAGLGSRQSSRRSSIPDLGLCWWFPGLFRGARNSAQSVEKSHRASSSVSARCPSGSAHAAARCDVRQHQPRRHARDEPLLDSAYRCAVRDRRVSDELGAMAPDAGCSPPSHWPRPGRSPGQVIPRSPENSLAPTSASIWVSDHLPRAAPRSSA